VKKTISFDLLPNGAKVDDALEKGYLQLSLNQGKIMQVPYQTNSMHLTEPKENLSEGRIF